MSVYNVVRYSVSCDHCGSVKLDGGVPERFHSYANAVSLAKSDGWIFTPDRLVICPSCALGAEL